MAERTFSVSDIHCGGCESAIEMGLRRLDGVRAVKADHQAQLVTVRYDEHRVDDARLADQLADLGFQPAGANHGE